MEPIAPLSSSPVLGSSTSGTGGQQQHSTLFHEGQTFHAQVLAAAENDAFILDIGGSKLLARGDSVSLRPGLSLQLQVTATTPTVEFKILSAPLLQNIGRALNAINQNIDLAPLLQLLQQPPADAMLASMRPLSRDILQNFWTTQQSPVGGTQSGNLLHQMVERLGLRTESRLSTGQADADSPSLKSALLELISRAGDNEEVKETAKSLVATIEAFQVSQIRLEQDRTQIIPLPFPFLNQGYLLVDEQTEREDGGEQTGGQQRFSLHLALSGLGNLQINFLRTPEGLWMRFNCDSLEKVDFISQYGDELKAQLQDIPLQGLSFAASAGDPGADLIRLLMPSGQSLLNTKA